VVVAASGDYTTDQITEGTAQFFTAARAQAALSGMYQTPISGAPGTWPTLGTAASHAATDFQAALANYSTISGLTGYPSTFPPTNSGNWAGTWQTYSPSYFQPSLVSYSTVTGLWTTCTTGYLKFDGTCSTPNVGGTAWGAISGTLASQTDLASALSGKQASLTNYSTISGLTGYPSTFPPTTSGDWAGTWQTYSPGYFQTAINGQINGSNQLIFSPPSGHIGLNGGSLMVTVFQVYSTGTYQNINLANTSVTTGLYSWNLGKYADTYFGNTAGAFVLTGDYWVSGVHDHTVAPIIAQPNGDLILAGATANATNGNVGIGIMTPSKKLSVAGGIQSTVGGFTFPDGSTQMTAVAGGGNLSVSAYNFTPYSCNMTTSTCTPGGTSSGTLSSGTHTLTFTPCPVGAASFVPASPHAFWYYISGGSGTAESVYVSGTTCTSGAATGTMTLYSLSYSHTGAFVIGSATAGAQEAAIAAGASNSGHPTGPLYFPVGTYLFYAPVYIDNGARVFGDGTSQSFISNENGGTGLFDVDGGPAASFSNLQMDSIGAVSNGNYAIRVGANVETSFSSVDHVLFNNFYDEILGVSMNQLHVSDSTFYQFYHTAITAQDTVCPDCGGPTVTSSRFLNYSVSPAAEAAILINSGAENMITNNTLDGESAGLVKWFVEYTPTSGDGGSVHIHGNKCEWTTTGCFSITGAANQTEITGNSMSNSGIDSGWVGTLINGTSGTGMQSGTYSANSLWCLGAASSNGLYLQGTYSGWSVSGNTIDGCNFGINANGSPTNVVLGINNITNWITSPVYVASTQVVLDGTAVFNYYQATDTGEGIGNAGNGSRVQINNANALCTGGGSTGNMCIKENGVWTH
jgi:hypothetical protein